MQQNFTNFGFLSFTR